MAAYCSQTKNDLKIERIKETVENMTKYKMDVVTSLLLKYAPDCKICHRHDHMLPQCLFKSI